MSGRIYAERLFSPGENPADGRSFKTIEGRHVGPARQNKWKNLRLKFSPPQCRMMNLIAIKQ